MRCVCVCVNGFVRYMCFVKWFYEVCVCVKWFCEMYVCVLNVFMRCVCVCVCVFSIFVRCLISDLLMLCSVACPLLYCTSHAVAVITYWLQTANVLYKTADAVLIADVKERVELYRCSPSGISWLVIGCILLHGGVKIYAVVCIRRSVEMKV